MTSGGKRWVTNLVTCSNLPRRVLHLVRGPLGGGVSDGRLVVAKCEGLFIALDGMYRTTFQPPRDRIFFFLVWRYMTQRGGGLTQSCDIFHP